MCVLQSNKSDTCSALCAFTFSVASTTHSLAFCLNRWKKAVENMVTLRSLNSHSASAECGDESFVNIIKQYFKVYDKYGLCLPLDCSETSLDYVCVPDDSTVVTDPTHINTQCWDSSSPGNCTTNTRILEYKFKKLNRVNIQNQIMCMYAQTQQICSKYK